MKPNSNKYRIIYAQQNEFLSNKSTPHMKYEKYTYCLEKKIAIFVSNTSRMSSLAPYSNIWYTNFIDPPFSTSFGPPYCTQLWLDSSDRILCIQNYTSTIQHLALFSIAGLTSTQIFFFFFFISKQLALRLQHAFLHTDKTWRNISPCKL